MAQFPHRWFVEISLAGWKIDIVSWFTLRKQGNVDFAFTWCRCWYRGPTVSDTRHNVLDWSIHRVSSLFSLSLSHTHIYIYTHVHPYTRRKKRKTKKGNKRTVALSTDKWKKWTSGLVIEVERDQKKETILVRLLSNRRSFKQSIEITNERAVCLCDVRKAHNMRNVE